MSTKYKPGDLRIGDVIGPFTVEELQPLQSELPVRCSSQNNKAHWFSSATMQALIDKFGVTRKEEPPAFIMAKFRTCHGVEPHVMEFEVEHDDCGIGNYDEGHLIAHDTPENRRLLSLKIVAEGEIGRDEDNDVNVNGVWGDLWLQSNTKPGHTLLIVEEQP